VPGLVDPVEAEDVAEQFVELCLVADVLDVVQLGEPFDHAGQQQRGERRGGEDGAGDVLAAGHQATAGTEPRLELIAGPTEHLLVLDLLLGEAQQGPQPRLVAIDVAAGVVDHHRHDVLLDEGEDVAVAVAADLVQHPLLVVAQTADGADAGDPVGQERLGEVEVAASEAVVDRPGVLHRTFEAGLVAVLVGQHC
jgi:hypothetical protein